MKMIFRIANLKDLSAITEIYNDIVLHGTATFDTEPKTEEQQLRWFELHTGLYPLMVAEDGGKVAGWGSLSPWSDRCAYAETAEISTYVHSDYRGMGVGKRLKTAVVEEGRKRGLHALLSRVVTDNLASIKLNEQLGFTYVGTLKEVGMKFGRRLDVAIWQYTYH